MAKKLSLIEKAAKIAVIAHEGQKRKDDASPYIVHPFMVALKLAKYNFEDAVIAAALVHDVLEDTDLAEQKIKEELGNDVLNILKSVTEDNSLSWEERKIKYVEALRNSSEKTKAISVSDKIHNAESLLAAYDEQGVEVWKHFNRGRDKKIWFEKLVLEMLQETWIHPLVDEYAKLVARMEKLR